MKQRKKNIVIVSPANTLIRGVIILLKFGEHLALE